MAKHKIVLIEDDESLSKYLREELEEGGFEVVQAFDGEEGLEKVRSDKPDLILLDVVMPKKTGFEVLEELKKSPLTREIPVILITMSGGDEEVKRGLRLGANDYIVKSQHAVGEIVEKIKNFFTKEAHPQAEQPTPLNK